MGLRYRAFVIGRSVMVFGRDLSDLPRSSVMQFALGPAEAFNANLVRGQLYDVRHSFPDRYDVRLESRTKSSWMMMCGQALLSCSHICFEVAFQLGWASDKQHGIIRSQSHPSMDCPLDP